jgi:tRNA/rRNA methyltransferase
MVAPHPSRSTAAASLPPAPVFVLVEPQMGENIGAVARAMLNFGLTELRLVNPRDGWPNRKAEAMAAGADAVIAGVKVCASTQEAIAECNYVVATTTRPREMLLPVLSPEEAAASLKARIARGERCAVLFGGESCGLLNEDVARADAIVSIPVNPAFSSLNLAQAALVLAYEWGKAAGRTPAASEIDVAAPASKEEFERLIAHLFGVLDARGYFFPEHLRASMKRNLRVALTRAAFTEPEVRTLRGVVSALENPPKLRRGR